MTISERDLMKAFTFRCCRCKKRFGGNAFLKEPMKETYRPMLVQGWRVFSNTSKRHPENYYYCPRCHPNESGCRWIEYVLGDDGTIQEVPRVMGPSGEAMRTRVRSTEETSYDDVM